MFCQKEFKKNLFNGKIFIYLQLFLISLCSPKVPQNIEPGKYTCAHCIMQIVDTRFNTQAQSSKGKIFHFDSIECLFYWINKNSSLEIKNAWVKDYTTGEWIPFETAFYVVSPTITSPMGANLSAFQTQEKGEEFIKHKTGKIYNYKEVWDYLQKLESKPK